MMDGEDTSSTSSDSDSEWIEIEPIFPPIPNTLVEPYSIEIPLHAFVDKRKQSRIDRKISLFEKERRIKVHSTHLMLLLARLQLVSRVCSEQFLQSFMMSLLPQQLTEQSHSNLKKTLLWFKLEYSSLSTQLDTDMVTCIEKYQLRDTHLLVSLLRAIGYRTRLVHNMLPSAVNKEARKQKNSKASKQQVSTSCGKSPYFKSVPVRRQSDRPKRRSVECTDGSDGEFQTPQKKSKRRKTTEEYIPVVVGECVNEWLEVRPGHVWTPVHPKLCHLTEPHVCAQLATPGSLMYVVACEESRLRDVSARYCLEWGGKYMKFRPDNGTWENLLSTSSHSQEEVDEEKQLMQVQMSLPLPSTLSHFKSNPIYTLEGHLLKYQAIYPFDASPVGSFRGDRVFLKVHVVELHTRENWLKEGRVICSGSAAYKVVRGRNKPGSDTQVERKIELFGKWQTEIYVPLPVVDGKIPKNEFGNVELFQDSMLPKGAAHVAFPGCIGVSKKLGIDYALAMVGWEFHGIACHPVFRGVVVAVENKQLLLDACREGEEAKLEKEREVRERKVFERWRRVIRSVLIKQRVCQKYKLDEI